LTRLSSKKNGKPSLRARKLMNWWEKVKKTLSKGWDSISPHLKNGVKALVKMGSN
jgi:hypothetical protein